MSATVESIPVDQCICGTRRRSPRPDCWATLHDCESRLDRVNAIRAKLGAGPFTQAQLDSEDAKLAAARGV